ncbi:MAG: hypothetical protein IE925_05210 [Rhodobacterales bacterium]|nr:hypothetical protein [Rhodobacterales bacterium]
MTLQLIDNFGDVAAEEDAVLDYFLSTDTAREIETGKAFLVLGRKGTGKTALVRYMTEATPRWNSKSLNLRNYPWAVHATRTDRSGAEIEAYVASWRYLIAVELAKSIIKKTGPHVSPLTEELSKFLTQNYGGLDPSIGDILRPNRLNLNQINFAPSIFGNKLGEVGLDRAKNNLNFGPELNALTDAINNTALKIIRNYPKDPIQLHFDELDQGLSDLDEVRSKLIIGLVLAARDTKRFFADHYPVYPVVYLRTDLWGQLQFSDKNKITQGPAIEIFWNEESLKDLVNIRIGKRTNSKSQWDDIEDGQLMRGTQKKWSHIVKRTLLRPRDVIQYLNIALDEAKSRDLNADVFISRDISQARNRYSDYLKAELDDEIRPHWPNWDEALQACSEIAKITFSKEQFASAYATRKASQAVDVDEALRQLFRFSVIGYRQPGAHGGSRWLYNYEERGTGWDNGASTFQVHLGLKEHAKLREGRA